MKKFALMAIAAILSSPVIADDADTCGSVAGSVVAAYSMAESGIPMWQAISNVEGTYIRKKTPAKLREIYMRSVRDVISAGYTAYQNGMGESETYNVAYHGCINGTGKHSL